jgi:hypothetical protein
MKVLKAALLVVVLLCLGIVAGCQDGQARSSSNRVVWEQGQTGFPHPSITYTDAR